MVTYTPRVMHRFIVLAGLLGTVACASAKSEPAAAPPLAKREPLAPAPAERGPPPAEERRCDKSARRSTDNLNVVVDDADGELGAALGRVPADAAGQWAEVLHRLAKQCAGSEVEHALPATRVVLKTPAECRAGAPQNELVLDFVPRGEGSAVTARGNLLAQGRALRVDVRIDPSADARTLCAAGRIDTGTPAAGAALPRAAEPSGPEAAAARQRWLVVPFQLVGGVLGLLPLKR